MLVKDKMWKVQQPGTILRARHSARRGQLALVLARAEPGPRPSNGYPPRRYVKMQMCDTGERFEELLVDAHNCWEIVSEP